MSPAPPLLHFAKLAGIALASAWTGMWLTALAAVALNRARAARRAKP